MTAHPPKRLPASKPRLSHTKPLINGVVAGLIATAQVPLLMFGWHRNLPVSQHYPLPPSLISKTTLERCSFPEAPRPCEILLPAPT